MKPLNPPTSFAARLAKRDPDRIYLVRGNDSSDRPAWYYLLVDLGKKRSFEFKARQGQINLMDYGKILFSGFGADPPEEARKRMLEDYGFQT